MRYFLQLKYAGDDESFIEQTRSAYDRYMLASAAVQDGAEVVNQWEEQPPRLTIATLYIRQVRSRASYRRLCRLMAGGLLNARRP